MAQRTKLHLWDHSFTNVFQIYLSKFERRYLDVSTKMSQTDLDPDILFDPRIQFIHGVEYIFSHCGGGDAVSDFLISNSFW